MCTSLTHSETYQYISYFYLHHTLSLILALLCNILSFTRWKTYLKIEIQDPHPWNSLHELESLFLKMEVLNVYPVSHTKTSPRPHKNINKISLKLCGNITQKLMKKNILKCIILKAGKCNMAY